MPTTTPFELLNQWVARLLPPDGRAWFDRQIAVLRTSPSEKDLYLALGYATRRMGKADLALSAAELAAADAARPGWRPDDWSVDQAGRIAFMLASHDGDEQRFKVRLEQLFRTADIGELITFYRGLPLYPGQKLHVARAREGARTTMRPIFEAVAHRNPYPVEHFDEHAWNHMVLKALFIETALHPIQSLDKRANAPLSRMLCDYAHERWAAGRPVSHELWRCVGQNADAAALSDLERVVSSGGDKDQLAAALALAASPAPRAKVILAAVPDLVKRSKTTGWEQLGGA